MFSPSRPVNRRTFDPMCAETGFGIQKSRRTCR